MRIVAGTWRGRALACPPGTTTRPTADRARQMLFDMLAHAPWAGGAAVEGATVLDLFAGTGALGLEALSRGAACAVFVEQDRSALAALRANIAACRAASRSRVIAGDATQRPPGEPDERSRLVFLDPPYDAGLIEPALASFAAAGWIAEGAIVAAEIARDAPLPITAPLLAERRAGAARFCIWRHTAMALRAAG